MSDAEVIAIAARQAELRFVEPKTQDQQARAVLFRGRERLVHQRTEQANALRAMLYEFGQIVTQGIGHIKCIDTIIRDEAIDLPDIVREEYRELLAQIDEKTTRIEEKTVQITNASRDSAAAQRLQTRPGVGPMIALEIEAFAPAMTTFRSGRDFAAWLGLVPRQFSSSGKERFGRVSKAGQADIRRLLIIGAMSHVRVANRKPAAPASWLARMLARKPKCASLSRWRTRWRGESGPS